MRPTDDDLVLMIHQLQRAVMDRFNVLNHPVMEYQIDHDYFSLSMELDLSDGDEY